MPQFNLGQAYRLGRGVPINLAAAQDLVRAGGEQGPSRRRRRRLACCCSRTATRPTGMKWLRQAADQGEPRALLVYGTALYQRRRSHAGPHARLCLCQPRRRRRGSRRPRRRSRSSTSCCRPSDRRKALAHRRDGEARKQPRRRRGPTPARSRQAKPAQAAAGEASRDQSSDSRCRPHQAGTRARRAATGGSSSAPSRSAASAEALYQQLVGKASLAGRTALSTCRPDRSPASRSARSRAKAAAAAACRALGAALLPRSGEIVSA